jgi:predicted transcriptional regulator
MKSRLKNLLKRAETWPEVDQEALAACAAKIESNRALEFRRTEWEWDELQQGIAAADPGELMSDEAFTDAG